MEVQNIVSEVKKFILRELIKKRKIGGAHTPLHHVIKKLPDELLRQMAAPKIVEKAVKELLNNGMVIIL